MKRWPTGPSHLAQGPAHECQYAARPCHHKHPKVFRSKFISWLNVSIKQMPCILPVCGSGHVVISGRFNWRTCQDIIEPILSSRDRNSRRSVWWAKCRAVVARVCWALSGDSVPSPLPRLFLSYNHTPFHLTHRSHPIHVDVSVERHLDYWPTVGRVLSGRDRRMSQQTGCQRHQQNHRKELFNTLLVRLIVIIL